MLDNQGEFDASYGVPPAVFLKYKLPMIAALRANVTGASGAWYVMGQMLPEAITDNTADNATVTATYPGVDAAHTMIGAGLSKAAKVSIGTGYNTSGDRLHYGAVGNRLMGTAEDGGVPTAIANSGDTTPAAPTGMSLGAATASTQVVNLGTSTGARWYELDFCIAGSNAWQQFRAGTLNAGPTLTVTGLKAGTSYDYRSRGANIAGASTNSATATGATSAGSDSTYFRFSLFTNCVEDGVGPFQYWEMSNAAGYLTSRVGGSSKKMAALAATHSVTATTKNLIGTMFGVVTAAATNPIWNTASTGYLYGLYTNSSSYGVIVGQTTATANGTAVTPANGDIMRIRRTDDGSTSTVFLEVAHAATPTTFVVVHTVTTASRADLWPCLTLQAGRGSVVDHVGMV